MSRRVSYVATGPLFDGRASRAVNDTVQEFEQEYAKVVLGEIQGRLKTVLRHPTGRYQSRVVTDRSLGSWQVWDQRSVYGPWLEGTGSRNRATRFKGYRTFRLVTQRLDNRATQYARAIMDRHAGELT